ncbi:MAG: hypothetical protein HKO53_07685, partial [Gemmatimonadetes bacterium]|nr:hypothetical protein [Gemmatimonadota bacterium]
MWVKTTRITLLVAILLAVAVLAYLAAHPRLYAAHVGRMISRNLLADTGISFACRDLDGNPLRRLRFYDVSMTRRGDDGSFAYMTCDSLDVSYDLPGLMGRRVAVPEFVLYHPQVAIQQGSGPALPRSPRPARPDTSPSVRVDRAAIFDGSLRVTSPTGEVVEELTGLHWEGSLASRDDGMDVAIQAFTVQAVSRDVSVRSLSGRLVVGGGRVEWNEAAVQTDSTQARSTGFVAFEDGDLTGLEFTAEAPRAHLGEVLRALQLPPGPRLLLEDGRVTGRLDGDQFRLSGQGHGTLEYFPFVAEHYESTFFDDGMRFDAMEGVFLGARGSATGTVDFGTKQLQLTGSARGADPAAPWTGQDLGWPSGTIDGDFDLRMDVNEPPTVNLRVERARGEMLSTALDSITVDFTFHEDVGLTLHEARLRAEGTVASATGTIDPDENAELVLRAEAASLDRWADRLGLAVEGRGLE